LDERLGIAGAGAIACGLAATAATQGEVLLWARSDESAKRARATVKKICSRTPHIEDDLHSRVRVVCDLAELAQSTFIVEAVVEDHESKCSLLTELASHAGDDVVLGTTTSSLSISALADASGRPDRFVGLHVFNPVARMELVELAFPSGASDDTRSRARELCTRLGKKPVEVPDIPGFVVNRLLFPYLFSAVELIGSTGLSASDVDSCMKMGAGMPMGPLALLDFVGLDVAQAIGEAIDVPVPEAVRSLVAAGSLGRKSGHGFYSYE
jgi:3-hydroxybutyryl-CoA dehydrogenase